VPNLGFSELIVILMILLLVFGASRLPQLGESLGRTIRSFKRGLSSDEQIAIKPDAPAPPEKPATKPSSDVSEAEVIDPKR
jgi:sec-independent protein translocase protein TatA